MFCAPLPDVIAHGDLSQVIGTLPNVEDILPWEVGEDLRENLGEKIGEHDGVTIRVVESH